MKTRAKRVLQIAAAAFLLVQGTNLSRADLILFDPDGLSGIDGFGVNYFDLSAANSLARGALPFTVSNTFQLLFHAQRNSVFVETNEVVFPFEVTVVGSVTERVTTVNDGPPSRVTFQMAKNQASDSFVELYSGQIINADPSTGTGYNDGTLILGGSPITTLPNVGTFCLADPQPTPAPNFDLFGTNESGATTSVVGVGATKLTFVVGFVDRRFFPAQAAGVTGRPVQVGDIVTLDLSHAAPFNGVDPSRAFTGTRNLGTGAGPAPGVVPVVGAVNGISGPDLQTQGTIGIAISPSPTPGSSPVGTPSPNGPKVILSASRAQLREGNDSVITFSVTQAHSDITALYAVGGSATLGVDYTITDSSGNVIVPGSIVIPAGQTFGSIVVHSILDTVKEPNGEPVKITLLPGIGYQVPPKKEANTAIVLILDRSG
ncbi:MAG: hypothetical protein ACJ8M1_00900 [Chthoniobacterales bacterium]